MKIICIYRQNQDYSGQVEDWLRDFYRQTGRTISTMNPDDDPHFCELHDVTSYPAFLALDDAGTSVAKWQGSRLPLFNEIMYYII